MTNNNGAYFAQRAAEELAMAERATCVASARVHRELSLRYSLKQVLPEPQSPLEVEVPIAVPKAPIHAVLRGPSICRKATS